MTKPDYIMSLTVYEVILRLLIIW